MKKLLSLLFFICSAAAHAAVTAPSTAFDTFMWQATGGAAQTVTYGTGGTPLVSPGLPVVDTDGGLPKVTQSASVKNPSGNPVSVSLLSRVPAAAVGSLLLGGLNAMSVLASGIVIYDFLKSEGFLVSKNNGALVVKTPGVLSYNTSSPAGTLCYSGAGNNPDGTCPKTMVQYCNAATTNWTSIGPWNGFPNVCLRNGTAINVINSPTGSCPAPAAIQPYTGTTTWSRSGTEGGCYTTTTGPDQDSSVTALQSAIAAKSGWPSGSLVSQALVDAAAASGQKITPSTGTLTGPATSTGSTSTTTNPDGTKTVITNNYTHNYAGNTITTGATTTTNTYNSSNVLTGTTTATSTDTPPKTDSQTDCDKYPESIGCSKYGTPSSSDTLDKRTSAVTITPSTFSGSGACPSPVTFSVASHTYSFAYTDLCTRLAALRTLFLAIAAFIAAWVVASALKV